MKELTLEDCKKIQLDILKHFDSFCRQQGLKYSIGEGSLIGAMRHKGFIPWDDDIDILMVREEFEKFCSLYKNTKYPLLSNITTENWFDGYVSLIDPTTEVYSIDGQKWNRGVWVTILPIDNYPNGKMESLLFAHQLCFWYKLCNIKKSHALGGTLVTTIFRYFICKCYSLKKLSAKFEKCITKYKNIQTQKRGSLTCAWHKPWVCSFSAFEKYLEVQFEDISVMVFAGYDEYLRCQYGNWTQLPPIEQQVCKHTYIAYLKDENTI